MDEGDEDAFAKELAQGMESLMREIAGEAGVPEAGASGDMSESERDRALKAAWEAMLVEGMDGNIGQDGIAGLGGEALEKDAGSGKDNAGGFQDKIKQAMNKMKENEAKIQARRDAHQGNIDPLTSSVYRVLVHHPVALPAQNRLMLSYNL